MRQIRSRPTDLPYCRCNVLLIETGFPAHSRHPVEAPTTGVHMTVRNCVARALVLLALLMSSAAFAQPYDYHVYIDSDLRASTGCTVSAGGQTFEGADYRLTATVSGNPPVVTARTLTPCSGGSFGAGGALGAFPVLQPEFCA